VRFYTKIKHLKHPLSGIIFDMDGVIVDSMPYHFLAWYEALRPLGVRVSCFDVFLREGERWEKSLCDFLKRAGIKPTSSLLKKIFTYRQKIFRSYFKRVLFRGVEDFLIYLKEEGYLLGLVTGTPKMEIEDILPGRIQKLFHSLVAGDQVRLGKPSPQPYLKALKLLGLSSRECVVVENAPLGIKSAKRAGLSCIALTSSLPPEYLTAADIVVDKLEDIIPIINSPSKI
jgi:beta-phosphoglucomutase